MKSDKRGLRLIGLLYLKWMANSKTLGKKNRRCKSTFDTIFMHLSFLNG